MTASQPPESLIGLLAFFAILVAALRRLGRLGPKPRERDQRRWFNAGEREEIKARAGHRCEHHHPVYGRCPRTQNLHADHVHPHARGGWTSVHNGQALCRMHNKAKAARVPSDKELRKLAERRARYFPPEAPRHVVRWAPLEAAPPHVPSAWVAPPLMNPPARGASAGPPQPPAQRAVAVGSWAPEIRRFDPARSVEILVNGTWVRGLQQAWRQEAAGVWLAEVSWFCDYNAGGGLQIEVVSAARVRPPAR